MVVEESRACIYDLEVCQEGFAILEVGLSLSPSLVLLVIISLTVFVSIIGNRHRPALNEDGTPKGAMHCKRGLLLRSMLRSRLQTFYCGSKMFRLCLPTQPNPRKLHNSPKPEDIKSDLKISNSRLYLYSLSRLKVLKPQS